AFSGGKAIRGPNDTGLLLGRRSLIEAAKLNANPYCGTIGRMMKVSKEDMIALLAAVERFVRLDHDAERRGVERRVRGIEGGRPRASRRSAASGSCRPSPTTCRICC